MKISGYQDLDLWKKAMAVSKEVKRLSYQLPKVEQFGLASQIRDAADSVPSNIAEGYGRGSRNDYVHFLDVALGSNNEVQTQLFICVNCGYLSKEETKHVVSMTYDVGRMLYKLIRKLRGS